MVDHEDEKTQILADPGDLGLDDGDDEDNEKTRMIDPAVLAQELDSSRQEKKSASAKAAPGASEKPGASGSGQPPPQRRPEPPPQAPMPPPEPGPDDFDKTRDAPWKSSGGAPPHPPPPKHSQAPFSPPPPPPPPPPPRPPGGSSGARAGASPEDSLVPKLKYRPEYADMDLSDKPLHQLKKMLNEAEGRMTLHETQLFQLEEVQGEKFKSKPGDSSFVEEVRALSEHRDIEREKMRAALVDVQVVSEVLVKAFNRRQARQMGVSVDDYLQRKRKDHQMTIMPWYYPKADIRRIRLTTIIGVVVGLIIAFYIPTVEVPPKLITKTVIPDRLANMVLERKKRPPPPPPPTLKPKVEKPVEKKEVAKPEKPEETRLKPKPREQKPRTVERERARERAKSAGLAKQASVLQDLVAKNTKALKSLGASAGISTGGSTSTRRQRKITAVAAGRGSGGIKVDRGRRSTGGVGGGLGKSGGSGVVSGIDTASFEQAKQREIAGAGGGTGRADEEIQIVFDKNQARLYRIYQKALRKNPALRGKVVFQLTISPEGKVTTCKVVSSDLNSPALEASLVKRIKLMKFPAKPGSSPVTIKYPIDFLPS